VFDIGQKPPLLSFIEILLHKKRGELIPITYNYILTFGEILSARLFLPLNLLQLAV
jgi:hypothetical protein